MTAQAMMRVKFKRPPGFNQQGEKARDQLKKFVFYRLSMGLMDFQESIMGTPVYTGRTMVNFRWSLGAPVEGTRAAVKEPALPGKTSDQPIGTEPRRAANAAVVQYEFAEMLGRLRANPFRDIYLRNNLAHFSDVEYGTYAKDGKISRTPPGGMTRRGETLLEYAMMGIFKRVA